MRTALLNNGEGECQTDSRLFPEKKELGRICIGDFPPWQLNVCDGEEGCFSHLAHRHLFVGLEQGNAIEPQQGKVDLRDYFGGEDVEPRGHNTPTPGFPAAKRTELWGTEVTGLGEGPGQAVVSEADPGECSWHW